MSTNAQEHRVKVSIMDEEFTIRTNADEDHIHRVVERVEGVARQFSAGSKPLSPKTAAILTAFNLADELLRIEHDYDTLIGYLEGGVLGGVKNAL